MTTEPKIIHGSDFMFKYPELQRLCDFIEANGLEARRILMNSEVRVYPDKLVVDYVRMDGKSTVLKKRADGELEPHIDERQATLSHVPEKFGITWDEDDNCQISPDTVSS